MNDNNYGIDWKNVDLSRGYNRDQNILEPYSFGTLLLEVDCNLKEITVETVREQAKRELRMKYLEAMEVLENNLENITRYAQAERNKP